MSAALATCAMRCFLSALTLLLLALATSAQAERLPIKAYTTSDGLGHIRVRCVVADSRGFIWFCGPEGLSRFDGQGFTTYGAAQGLADTRVNDFLETSRGAYWVATNGGGVYRFNPAIQGPLAQRGGVATDSAVKAAGVSQFTAFPIGDNPQTNRVNVLYEDRAGRLWAGTDGGLFCFQESVDRVMFRRVNLRLPARPDPAVQVWAFAEDREGNLWIGTSWGLVRRLTDGRTIHMEIQPAQGADHVRALLVDGEDRVWIGHETGLIVLRPADGRSGGSSVLEASPAPQALRPVKLTAMPGESTRYGAQAGLSGGTVRALLQSADGHIWIGTWDGLTEFDGERFTAFTRAQGVGTPIALGAYNFFARVRPGVHTVQVMVAAGSGIDPGNPPQVGSPVLTLQYR
jgi:ligand-binding sensor domain-containing protein